MKLPTPATDYRPFLSDIDHWTDNAAEIVAMCPDVLPQLQDVVDDFSIRTASPLSSTERSRFREATTDFHELQEAMRVITNRICIDAELTVEWVNTLMRTPVTVAHCRPDMCREAIISWTAKVARVAAWTPTIATELHKTIDHFSTSIAGTTFAQDQHARSERLSHNVRV